MEELMNDRDLRHIIMDKDRNAVWLCSNCSRKISKENIGISTTNPYTYKQWNICRECNINFLKKRYGSS